MCKLSPIDVSMLETAVNWIMFSYPSKFKCLILATVTSIVSIYCQYLIKLLIRGKVVIFSTLKPNHSSNNANQLFLLFSQLVLRQGIQLCIVCWQYIIATISGDEAWGEEEKYELKIRVHGRRNNDNNKEVRKICTNVEWSYTVGKSWLIRRTMYVVDVYPLT